MNGSLTSSELNLSLAKMTIMFSLQEKSLSFYFFIKSNIFYDSRKAMDDFFHDIESVKSSRFSISKPDAPTGLYLEEYDQYLTNDQELIIITGNTIVI